MIFNSKETKILIAIKNGITYEDIARTLDITNSTMAYHLMNIYNKTQNHINYPDFKKFAKLRDVLQGDDCYKVFNAYFTATVEKEQKRTKTVSNPVFAEIKKELANISLPSVSEATEVKEQPKEAPKEEPTEPPIKAEKTAKLAESEECKECEKAEERQENILVFKKPRMRGINDELTEREQEVLHSLLETTNYKASAEKLCITETTLRTHVNNIFAKWQINSLPAMIKKFYTDKNTAPARIEEVSELRRKYERKIFDLKISIAETEAKIRVLKDLEKEITAFKL